MPAWTVSNHPKPRSGTIVSSQMSNIVGTCRTTKGPTEPGLIPRLARAAFIVVVGAVCGLAQNSALTPHTLPSHGSVILGKACLTETHQSDKITALMESIQDHPTAGAYNTLGVLFAQADLLNCAVPAFQTAVKLDPQNWEAHYNLALALVKKGERTEAKRELRAAIQQKSDSVSTHFALGSLLQSDNKWDEAAEEFKAALNVDPRFVPASLKLSQILT